jgi:hypothetical protein
MKHLLLTCLAAGGLAACITNAPIEGTVQRTGEQFRGFATGTLAGTLEIVSERTKCTGTYQTSPTGQSRGSFTCDDGRSGPFEFTRSGNRAAGRFLSQPFILTFA